MTLVCPTCMNPMRQHERHRVIVDQCTACGGLFLDRAELEALVAAERAHYGEPDPPSVPAAPPVPKAWAVPAPIYDDRRYDHGPRDRGLNERSYDDRRLYSDGYSGRSGKRPARSFLEELFDD